MTQQLSDDKRLPLVLTQGDPAGVGPQASLLAWQAFQKIPDTRSFYLRGNIATVRERARESGLDVDIIEISDPAECEAVFSDGLPVIDVTSPDVRAGEPDTATGSAIVESIRLGVDDVWNGKASAVVTNPIAKSLLKAAGFQHPGHTEYLAELAGTLTGAEAPHPVMMLIGGGLRVALTTIHMPLRAVPDAITGPLIKQVAEIVSTALKRDFAADSARIGVAGLNPHAGEDGMLGHEEQAVIIPALQELNASGINAIGPRPGDTVFHEMLRGAYDAVLAMYHDQGLAPLKTLDMWGGVNVTLGLPFIRTSPDHGTAYDAAGAFKVRADSLIAAINMADTMSRNRIEYDAAHD